MSDSQSTTLVAETDASGRVTHVWLSQPGWKSARPVAASDALAGRLARAEFHGAPRREISDWLRQNADLGG